MAKRRVRKNVKPASSENNGDKDGDPPAVEEEMFKDDEVERQSATIRALRDVEIEQLRTMICLLRSYLSKEQLQVPVKQFFKETLPDISIAEAGENGQYEVNWKENNGNIILNHGNEKGVHASLLHQLSTAYPDYSAGMSALGGFQISNKSVKTGPFASDKLQIRSLVWEDPSDSQSVELKNGLQTPNACNNRLSVGMTPKTLRLPKCGEMLLSVHGSPLGVFKDDNMETIQETDDD